VLAAKHTALANNKTLRIVCFLFKVKNMKDKSFV